MQKSALIIMPVGSDPDFPAKKAAFTRAVAGAGLEPIFPIYEPEDARFSPSEFRDQLRRAVIVLADLSRERPSCYFELGFAEALERPVQLFAEAGTPIHQSAYRKTVSFYGDLMDLEREITKALRSIHGMKFGTARECRGG